MSYRKKHVKNKINRITPKKPPVKKLWFWLVILLVAIVFSVFYFVIFYSGVQIKDILISGTEKVSAAELKNFISQETAVSLMKFWKLNIISKSIFLVSPGKLDGEVLKEFPLIEKISINKNLPQTLTVGVTERKPLGIYCPQNNSSDAENDCFFIDENGVAYAPSPVIPGDFAIVRQLSDGGQVFTGEYVVAKNTIDAIYKIQQNLQNNLHISLKEALLTSPIRLNVTTGANWKIYFDLSPDSDIDSQITKLNLLMNGQISPDSMKNLRYVNLVPKDRATVCDNSVCGE